MEGAAWGGEGQCTALSMQQGCSAAPPKPQLLLPTLQTKAATSKTCLLPSSDKPW